MKTTVLLTTIQGRHNMDKALAEKTREEMKKTAKGFLTHILNFSEAYTITTARLMITAWKDEKGRIHMIGTPRWRLEPQ